MFFVELFTNSTKKSPYGILVFIFYAAVAQPVFIGVFQFRFAWSDFDLLYAGDCVIDVLNPSL